MLPLRLLCRISAIQPFCKQSFTKADIFSRPLSIPTTNYYKSCAFSLPLLGGSIRSFDNQKNPIQCRQLSTNTPKVETKKRKGGLFMKTLKEYGSVFVVFHTCTSIITLAVFYVLVSRGVDLTAMVSFAENYINVDNILAKAGYDKSVLFSSEDPSNVSITSGIIAFLLYKLTSPIRLFLDSIMVPIVVRNLREGGLMQPETAVDDQTLARIEKELERFDKKYDVIDVIDLEPAKKVIRKRVAKRNERRRRQLARYDETQRKIDKVFKKKRGAKES